MMRKLRKIAVIGGGIFGCTTAWKLAKEGYDVTLYEKNDDIITQASYINQYRLHKGYHYPRSKETAQSSIWGEESFLREYGGAIVNGDVEHYYCIAKEDSLVNSDEYKTFLNDLNLKYTEKNLDLIHKNVVDLTVEVDELLFNPDKLKEIPAEVDGFEVEQIKGEGGEPRLVIKKGVMDKYKFIHYD